MKAKLKLKKLIISGKTYKRTLFIDDSIIMIRGDGFSGKSLVLNLIAYCLGGKTELIDLQVQKELALYCNEVFLELEINNKIYTINRYLKEDKNIINIYLCSYNDHKEYSPWKKKVEEANEFIANELQIPLHFILRKKSGSKDYNKENLSFRDFMRYVIIHQGDLGTSKFLKNDNTFVSGKNKEIFKIINNLIIPDLEEISNEVQINQNEYNKIEKINDGLEDYLGNRDATILIELINSKEKIQKDIDGLVENKNNILANNKNKSLELYSNLKIDIKNIDEFILEKNNELSNIKLSMKNKEILLRDYKEEEMQLSATLQAMKKVKIVEHSERCPLCHSSIMIKGEDDKDNYEDVERAFIQIKDKIETLNDLSDNDYKKVLVIENEYEKLDKKKKIYISALEKYQENLNIPYLSEIESINSMIRDYNIEKNKINSLVDIHNEINENKKNLYTLSRKLDELKKRKNELLSLGKREELILSRLNEIYRESMFRFNFKDIEEDKCYISKENYLPYYNGISVLKHTSGCLLLCMQIAYLGAILEVNSAQDENCHPGVIMLDTVSNNIGTNSDKDSIDPQTYNELYKYLYKLSEENQIFIIDNTPPKMGKKATEFIFKRVNSGEVLKGLIDLTKNEIEED